MTIVSDNLKRVLRVTKSPNPDAVDGSNEAWENPQGSTRPLAPVPTKPKECKCDEAPEGWEAAVWEKMCEDMKCNCIVPNDPFCALHAEPSGVSGQLPLSCAGNQPETGTNCTCEPVFIARDFNGNPFPGDEGIHAAGCPKNPAQQANCLQTADRLTSQDRNEAYGHPLDDYECTAALWTAILRHAGVLAKDKSITAELAIQCMIQVKLSREAFRHKDDNLIDAAGYGRCLEMVIQERARRALGSG